MRREAKRRLLDARRWGYVLAASMGLAWLPVGAQEGLSPAAEQPESPSLPVELIDPSPHLPGLPGWVMLLLIGIALAIAAGVVALVIQLSRNNETTLTHRQSPFQFALQQLESFRALPENTPLAEITTRISLALRGYLAASKSDSALYQTREEFLTDEERLRHVEEPVRSQTADFLAELSSLQYAPPTSDPEEVTKLIDQGIRILHNLAEPSPSPADHA
ncbi:hypothetical protein AAFN60_12180 [Roseibacillus persicicus]|uniref:hypothetical protein n=1 Tax=Roseibacillus persicicus TaxID=454148 RepID=UPI00398BA536